MKRVLSLVLVLMLVLTSIMPAFAEETAVEVSTETADLQSYGVVAGDGTGANEAGPLTRAAMTVLLAKLYGKQEEAAGYDLPGTFEDLEGIWEGYVPYINYAKAQGWMVGDNDTTFRPMDIIKAQEMNSLLLRALGYTVEEVPYADANAKAEELGFAVVAADPTLVLRGEGFKAIRMALDATPVGAEVTFGSQLELANYVAPEPPAPEALEVVSVTALNPKQVEVKFNQAVVESTIKAANIKVYIGTATTETAWTASLSEDGMTAILGLTGQVPQDTTVKVVAKDVENAAEEKLAETTMTATLKDITSPSVLSAKFTSSKTLEIMTTEPLELETGFANLHVLNNILVDGNKLVGSLAQDLDANKITVTFGAKVAVGEHTITVKNYMDYAGWKAPEVALTAEVVADTTAPSITTVVANRGDVTITFDEPVTTIGNVTINGATYTTGTTTDNKTFKITLNNANVLGLAYLVQGEISHYGATDNEGNVAGTAAAPVKVAFVANDDLEAPTATIALDASNNVIITFSEAMSDPGKVTVKNASGVAVASNVVPVVKTAATFEYKVTAANAGLSAVSSVDNYTITLAGAKDNSVRTNALASTEVTLAGGDVVSPTIVNGVLTQAHTTKVVSGVTMEDKKAQVTLYFSEVMDSASIIDANNYTFSVDGVATPVNLSSVSGVTLAAAADAKAVVITFPGTGTNGVTAGATTSSDIYALLVKDVAGNTLSTTATANFDFNEKIDVAAAAAAFILADADGALTTYGNADVVMTAPNTIKVGFSNPVAILDPSDFVLFTTGDTATVKLIGVSYSLNADSTVATITLNGSLTNDGKIASADGARADFYLKAGNTKDVFGNTITAAAMVEGSATNNASAGVVVADYVVPTLTKVEQGTAPNSFKFTFSEPVSEAGDGDFEAALVIKDKNGAFKAVGTGNAVVTEALHTTPSATVTVTLNATGQALFTDGTVDIQVSFPTAANLTDANANVLAPIADQAVKVLVDDTDVTATVAATTGSTNSATALVITYAEALYVDGVAATTGQDLKADYAVTTGSITSAIYDATSKTVTFVLVGTIDNDQITLVDASLTDYAGNGIAAANDVADYDAAGPTLWSLQ